MAWLCVAELSYHLKFEVLILAHESYRTRPNADFRWWELSRLQYSSHSILTNRFSVYSLLLLAPVKTFPTCIHFTCSFSFGKASCLPDTHHPVLEPCMSPGSPLSSPYTSSVWSLHWDFLVNVWCSWEVVSSIGQKSLGLTIIVTIATSILHDTL